MKLRAFFAALGDPRLPRTRRYPLVDIVLIVLCGLLCGADNYVEFARFAFIKRDWFKENLGIERIPSHDTLARVMAKIDPNELNQALMELAQLLTMTLPSKKIPNVIALDGKHLRGTLGNLNLVSAWASHAQMTLAVQAVPEDTNEIPVVQALLRLVDIKNSVVTADALHCQKETAQIIVDKEADYILCLKKNQGNLWNSANDYFERLVCEMGIDVVSAHTVEKAHGQWIEKRVCRLTRDVGWFDPEGVWAGCKAVAQIVYERRKGDVVKRECRYFVTSLDDPLVVLRCVRAHWGIENSQHWRLDVFYREDDSRVRRGNAATNLAILRRLSLSIAKRDKSESVGVQTRRRMAGWDNEYRERLLATVINL
jgi:predicted transposase YbfD/YdcC